MIQDGSWDCIVPWSGGKDSSSIAWKVKYEYGMNPLLVTFSPILSNEVGYHNREALINHGFDNIFRPNQKAHKVLKKEFLLKYKPKGCLGCWYKFYTCSNGSEIQYKINFLCRTW